MNNVAIIMAYYENAGMLDKQIEVMASYKPEVLACLSYVVVDDCSPRAPARPPANPPLPMTMLRMRKKIPWNQDACRNLGVAQSQAPVLLLTDIDHLIPPETAERVVTGKFDFGRHVFRFSRVSAPDNKPYKLHPNSWLMHRKQWAAIGGYDERFAGWYGTDGEFMRQVETKYQISQLRAHLIRVPREVQWDASTQPEEFGGRKQQRDKDEIKRIKIERNQQKGWKPLTLSQEWERVL